MTNELNIDIKEQEARKQEAVKEYHNQNLDWYLSALSKVELKNICRNLNIKGFSSKNKDDLIQLIVDTYFNDDEMLKAMLQTYDSQFKVVLDEITDQEKDYIIFHRDIPDDVFLFYAEGTELLFIPKDVKQHFLAFKASHPEFINEIEQIHFYRSALNLYGFVSLKHLSDLKKKYYGIDMATDEVKNELISIMPEYAPFIKDGGVKHIELAPIDINSKALTQNKNYYTPDLKTFKLYSDRFYVDATPEVNAFKKYLSESMTEAFRGTDAAELIINTILFGLRANETPNQILLHISNVENNGFMQIEDHTLLTKYIEDALRTTRLWRLSGHKRSEVKGVADNSQNVTKNKLPKKKTVQVKRKSKKRGKNKNIAHIARLNSKQ
ncbi:hypothetical protein [Macrococcoides caseolyticum]|uniref:hypothetical protein n=1 Tax=Macrococcoides caseolyticum TaxID=69966 RepID=UPI001F33F5B9|nr:hypothetical protein [Macrococcus caseolyticus]MCE4957779.1 hypothetical protein [Macrococcus caseolyticus]